MQGWRKKLLEILERITHGEGKMEDLDMIEDIARTMKEGSLCALGQGTPNPVLATLRFFRDEYEAHIIDKGVLPGSVLGFQFHHVKAPARRKSKSLFIFPK